MVSTTGRFTYLNPGIFLSDGDNETVHFAGPMPFAGVIETVVFWTSGALGASLGIDLLDGALNGAGTGVINSSEDNLNGYDINVAVNYGFDAGTILRLLVDNITAKDIGCNATIKIWLPF